MQKLAVKRLEALPPDCVPLAEAQLGGAVARPGPDGLAFLHHRQVIRGAALPGDRCPSTAPMVLNGYSASCPWAILTVTAGWLMALPSAGRTMKV